MCGIFGVIGPKAGVLPVGGSESLKHRGPDDFGRQVLESVLFEHRRLAILDLSAAGHQPMQSRDGRYIIVFNGEIYNHLELRREIGERYIYKSTSDTETLLAGFSIWRENLFAKLNGIFALAIYDKHLNQVVLARDHFGVKPLYWGLSPGHLYFASELKALARQTSIQQDIDYEALAKYLHYLYCPGDGTPFRKIRKFPPGVYSVIDVNCARELEFKKFYEIGFSGKYSITDSREAINAVDKALHNAVRRQLLSDVPVGFFLSGGVDSSLIVAIAKQEGVECPTCFTVNSHDEVAVGDEGFFNDIVYARDVARLLGAKLCEVNGNESILNDFQKMIWHLDEPLSDPAPLHVLNITAAARARGFKVMLGGAAGDDVFGGYRRHLALEFDDAASALPNSWWRGIDALLRYCNASSPSIRRIRKFLRYRGASKLERMAGFFEWLPFEQSLALFRPEHREAIRQAPPAKVLLDSLAAIPAERSPLNQMLFWEMRYFLGDHNLNYTDKLSMANGVEVRVPFLDVDLVELSTLIDPDLKVRSRETKWLLKRVAERYLPRNVVYREKSGFGAPVRKWVNRELRELIDDLLSPAEIERLGVFDDRAVRKLIEDNRKGKIDAAYSIWSLVSIQCWLRQFVR